MNLGNIFTSPLSSLSGSPHQARRGLSRSEMLVPRITLERGESSRGANDDSSSEEGEMFNVENRNICGWRNETYTPIFKEFIATLEVNEEIHDRQEPSIKFKIFHKEYEISSDELGNLLGFYTLHDQNQELYNNLINGFENEHQAGLFWWCISRPGVTWSASYTSARYIKLPELLIMWHIIARSWLGRRTPNDNVTREEVLMLWSMHTETPIHMGELCK
nr:hypothetical protein Iba_chr15eCG0110 [Ipomoea batatas]GME10942.1 hypothetical protein Iba_scaffold11181CG0010 [Ipomoea batatas]